MTKTIPYESFSLGVKWNEDCGNTGLFVALCAENSEKEKEACGIVFFERRTGEFIKKHTIPEQNRMGNVYYDWIEDVDCSKMTYLFFQGKRYFPDPDAKGYVVAGRYGEEKEALDYRAYFPEYEYDWGETEKPRIPFEDCIIYCLHVRGFTKHNSSGVKAKGTFAGLTEKIPYLRELGVTTVELQPCYEFDEAERVNHINRLNYWGYKRGYYYAPKSAYAHSKDAVKEFKDMVKAFHQNGMEVIMQFYFPDEVKRCSIPEILRYWAFCYQVDGFHLIGNGMPTGEVAADPFLSECKLLCDSFPTDNLYRDTKAPAFKHLAICDDGFQHAVRRFLKSDAGMLQDIMYRIRRNPKYTAVINYLTNYSGFTMMDMVTYNEKHNEANKEGNRDGSEYNWSWNCGEEGKTSNAEVLQLRKKQFRNAFAYLLLSQGTPMFFMGDEFGNSQFGNNNPYCQDNKITRLDWKDMHKNEAEYLFVKRLIALRKEKKVFHMAKECLMMDYKSCGYPDLSFHNDYAWRVKTDYEKRHIGYMLCGDYSNGCEGNYWYVAMNAHWEAQEFAMPKLPKGLIWEQYLSTEENSTAFEVLPMPEREWVKVLPPRSVTVFWTKENFVNELLEQ